MSTWDDGTDTNTPEAPKRIRNLGAVRKATVTTNRQHLVNEPSSSTGTVNYPKSYGNWRSNRPNSKSENWRSKNSPYTNTNHINEQSNSNWNPRNVNKPTRKRRINSWRIFKNSKKARLTHTSENLNNEAKVLEHPKGSHAHSQANKIRRKRRKNRSKKAQNAKRMCLSKSINEEPVVLETRHDFFKAPGNTSERWNRWNNNAHKNPIEVKSNAEADGKVDNSEPERRKHNSRRRYMGFKKLEELSTKEAETIIMELLNDRNGFQELLNTEITNDSIVLILRILCKMCESSFENNKVAIFSIIQEKFLKKLIDFLLRLPLQDAHQRRNSRHFWNNTDEFWNNIIKISTEIINIIPRTAVDILPQLIKALIFVVPNFEQEHHVAVPAQIKSDIESLQTKLLLCQEEIERKKKEPKKRFEEEPPDDFRSISIYPTTIEITQQHRSFVRENRINGPYDSVDQYLDIQFRLLREDFVAPLREGICEYLSNSHYDGSKKKKLFSVKIHPKIQFIGRQNVNDKVGMKLKFDFSGNRRRFRYENSKRFMFGALVCFTNDNFKSVIFAKIIERDVKLLEQGELVVGFSDESVEVTFFQDYLMVECSVYFEPYYYVLNALRQMNDDSFPMKEYIIDVEPYVEHPHYLTLSSTYVINGMKIVPHVESSWPSNPSLFGLNDVQYQAFKHSLSRELVIIQGPPGTGKTYLGLKIARTLLENKAHWFTGSQTPILIVCYTNHALDQFLEGLIGSTEDIIRVGGQSKNEALQKYNIINKRREYMCHKKSGTSEVLFQKKRELSDLIGKIKAAVAIFNSIDSYDCIFSLKDFNITDYDYADSWFSTKAKGQDILNWLLGGRTKRERQKEVLDVKVLELQNQIGEEAVNNDPGEDPEGDDVFYDADNREENMLDIDDVIITNTQQATLNIKKLASLGDMISEMKMLTDRINHLNAIENPDNSTEIMKFNTERELENLEDNFNYLKICLRHGPNLINAPKLEFVDYRSPQNMMPENRWKFYFYWLGQYRRNLSERMNIWNTEYQRVYREYLEVKDIEDLHLMRGMHIVGMTTTGAARLQTILRELKCKIVIVEEAAEVLESHIIVSLTHRCQHLILLGDHQQLRPSTANYTMETKYHLGISLFERMIRNNMPHVTLKVQHRMRPEISALIRPAIYPELIDHESVLNYPPVKGIDDCLYFLHHTNKEEDLEHTSSKRNIHEAKFLIRLAKHLVLNGYEPEDITILCAYLGQMYLMWEERKKYKILLERVKITVLDNYQGEESKIILLSLVRNNDQGKIGFLSLENRVCVALSRAKEGFYIMGNMDMLCAASKIWPKVKEVFVAQNVLGGELTLRCQLHQDEVTKVSDHKDFDRVPEGGCGRRCNAQLSCGHFCLSCCHIQNREHINYRCKVKCTKKLCENDEHVCKKLCYEECGPCLYIVKRLLSCGHEIKVQCHIDPDTIKCEVLVQTTLLCGHTTDKPCYIDSEKFKCPFPCDSRIEPCGHACILKCHARDDPDHFKYKCMKPCAKIRKGCTSPESDHFCTKYCYEECLPCDIVVKKYRTICPHVYEVRCDANVDEIVCCKPCKKTLPCGHKCKRKCFEECGKCEEQVLKDLQECGHKVKTKCFMEPERKNCFGKCSRLLSCGHMCKERCKDACTTKCMHLVDNTHVEPACKHKFQIPCYMNGTVKSNDYELLKYCNEKCPSKLECQHICSGTCGECVQGRIHKPCAEKCGRILVCSHECATPCNEACQPCTKACTYKCTHSRCRKKCGEVCTKCKEPCPRKCKHVFCKNRCGDFCSVKPCTQPCPKKLKCGHPCVGFCGDPCPPLCRICNKENEEFEIFLGYEDEEDARFVLLEECKHVLESRGLENWMEQTSNEIKVACCPKCKTPLTLTTRFSDEIKRSMIDIMNVKRQYTGGDVENIQEKLKLVQSIENLKVKLHSQRALGVSLNLVKFIDNLRARLRVSKNDKRQVLHKMILKTITSKLQIFEHIINALDELKTTRIHIKERQDHIEKVTAYVVFLVQFLDRNDDYITNQEIEDMKLEIMRLSRMVQLCKIEDHYSFAPSLTNAKFKNLYESINEKVFSIYKYTGEMDESLKVDLIELNKEIKASVIITEAERREIVRAIGLAKGHWYKCPNGHPYAIGECGGAMQVSKCFCGASIGGTQHRLLNDNTHAAEMDGSRYAAWSEQANMANYEIP